VPSVDDLAVAGGEKQQTRDRRAINAEARLAALGNTATADDPRRMLATAAQRPSASDPVPTIDHSGLAERPQGTAREDVRVAPVDLARRLTWEVAPEYAVLTTDRDTPAGCPVSARDFFDYPDERHRVGFRTAQAARYPQPKQTCCRQRLDQRCRQSPEALAFFRSFANLRSEVTGNLDKRNGASVGHDTLASNCIRN
jgi:hypothetical protein